MSDFDPDAPYTPQPIYALDLLRALASAQRGRLLHVGTPTHDRHTRQRRAWGCPAASAAGFELDVMPQEAAGAITAWSANAPPALAGA